MGTLEVIEEIRDKLSKLKVKETSKLDYQELQKLEEGLGDLDVKVFGDWKTAETRFYNKIEARFGYGNFYGRPRFVIQSKADMYLHPFSVTFLNNIDSDFLDFIETSITDLIKQMIQIEEDKLEG